MRTGAERPSDAVFNLVPEDGLHFGLFGRLGTFRARVMGLSESQIDEILIGPDDSDILLQRSAVVNGMTNGNQSKVSKRPWFAFDRH